MEPLTAQTGIIEAFKDLVSGHARFDNDALPAGDCKVRDLWTTQADGAIATVVLGLVTSVSMTQL